MQSITWGRTYPHRRRIIGGSWRSAIVGSAIRRGSQESAAAIVARHGLQENGELVELVLALTDAPAETILVALQSPDSQLRDAALLALMQSRYALSEHPRRKIMFELTKLSSKAFPASVQSMARNAMQAVRRVNR